MFNICSNSIVQVIHSVCMFKLFLSVLEKKNKNRKVNYAFFLDYLVLKLEHIHKKGNVYTHASNAP